MRFVRVERKDNGKGMYADWSTGLPEAYSQNGHSLNDCWDTDSHQPVPEKDSPELCEHWMWLSDRDRPKWKFGFKSFKQMLDWIKHEDVLDTLEEWGYVAAIYESEDVVVGNKQLVFHSERARRVEVRTLRGARVCTD